MANVLPDKKYKTIYADPPWNESGGGRIKRGADRHYNLMKTKDIMRLPVHTITEDNCHLYLWVTNNFLKDGLKVMETWGFKYITVITWLKGDVHEGLLPDDSLKVFYTLSNPGLGQYYRGLTEHCLFGRKGMLSYKTWGDKRCQGRTGFIEGRGVHSEKPDEMRNMIEYVSYPPYIELFARKEVDGWDNWGNEIGGS